MPQHALRRTAQLSSVLTLLAATLVLPACSPTAATPAAAAPTVAAVAVPAPSPQDAQFADLSRRWLDGAMRLSPVSATQTGDHRFDAELDDFSADGRARALAFSKAMLAELEALDRSKLSRENQVDASVLRNQLRYDVFNAEQLQGWAWDPMLYNATAGGALYGLMAREFAPMPDRLRSATARMEKLPDLFDQMRGNLDLDRVPKIHADTVAKQNKGILSLVDELIVPHAGELQGEERKRLDAAITGLRRAVDEHQHWIDKTLVPNAKGDFRIGAKLYDQKLAFALDSDLSRAEIRRRAQAELARVRAQMYGIAAKVLAGRDGAPPLPAAPDHAQEQAAIQAALELAYADRPDRDHVVDTAKSTLAAATEFVRAKDFITLPDAPVKVILMPEFQRGVTVAYCDSPGPLDKQLDTFYAVSPIPADWDEAKLTSYLREYNTRSIDELSIHEAMPGHYVQIWHSNKYPSTLRAVLASGSFVEGWAVYAEKVMADLGYRDNDPLYRLVQLKWYLRTISNAILDQAIHVDGMSREDAMALMTQETFQEEREAAGKWVRAQLSSAQLPTYFVGVQEHLDLRRAVEQKEGRAFNLKAYHDKVLGFGSPSARYVRALMLDEPIR
jgi:uncharacterized protein (DUF885 family)